MKRILVIQTASIGDVILVTPVLEKLHELYPAAAIDILVRLGNEVLFTEHPFIKKVWVWNKKTKKYPNLFSLLRQVREARYDLVINAQRFFSSGFITVLSGTGLSSGFTKNPFSRFFTYRVEHIIGDTAIHEAERNLRLIPGFHPVAGEARIRLYPAWEDYQRILEYQQGPYICISPASLWFTKQYPAVKWVEFIRSVPDSYYIYLLGSGDDKEVIQSIIELSGRKRVVSLAGELSLLQSAALMEKAAMNYVNDSAPLHLCSAVNAPVTAIFCSTLPAFGFGPYGEKGTVAETAEVLDCRPCGLHGHKNCPEKHFRCALGINNDQLLKRLDL